MLWRSQVYPTQAVRRKIVTRVADDIEEYVIRLDDPLLIGDNDPDHIRFHETLEAKDALAQSLFGALALRDIHGDADHSRGAAFFIGKQRAVRPDPALGTV